MLGFMSVVKAQTKPEFAEEYIRIFRNISIKDIPGIRRRSLTQNNENNYISVLEYDDIASLVAAHDTLLSFLDRLRLCLVELDEEGNVNEPVSGALIHDQRN